MSNTLPDDVRLALGQGNKIDAIRLLRDRTGLGLAEAKAAVESGEMPGNALSDAAAHKLSAEVTAALAQGNTIQAIKLLRQTKGLSLQQAKAIAEEAARTFGPPGATGGRGLAPGEVRRTSSLTVIVVLIAIAGVVVWLIFGRA
jgi:ribosomal protein L7/L12